MAKPVAATQLYVRGMEATAIFTAALRDLDARDLRTSCSDPEISHWWLSEDAGQRREAAKWCRSCPVLVECGEAASARQEKFGVYAGIDFTRNPNGRPRKQS
jgi:hypothetical protein